MKVNIYKIKRNGKRKYSHFDKRVGLLEAYSYVSNKENIEKHNFYPFIYYEKKTMKYSKTEGKREKIRPICYAAHIDRCIYQYYSYIFNEKYNDKAKIEKIDDSVIAYRTNSKGSNITLAKNIFDYIKENNQVLVIVGDFAGFFDNLDHKYLKQQICNLLNVEYLSKDMYKIFKSMTKYSKCKLEDILAYNGLRNTYKDIKFLNKQETVMQLNDFKKFKRDNLIKNKNNYGIPQGSSLSGIFSNIYMMDFDKKMRALVNLNNGIYRRYSDDFIIIIPNIVIDKVKQINDEIKKIVSETQGVTLEETKTKAYIYDNGNINNITSKIIINANDEKKIINYLGFSFDGKFVSIREKTLSKYFYRMRRKVDGIERNQRYTKKGKRISLDKLYKKYSIKGLYGKERISNFISYVRKSRKIFKDEKRIENIEKSHMRKIAMTIKEKKKKYSK